MIWLGHWLLLIMILFANSRAYNPLLNARLSAELQEITKQKLSLNIPYTNTNNECGIRISPLKSNMLKWHFSFLGVKGSVYDGGIYHGIITLHKDYPRKAPSVVLCTPSGRWHINKDICLSASAYHPESWNSDWNLRTLVLSLRVFMTTPPNEIGGITSSFEERRNLAEKSKSWVCSECGTHHSKLLWSTTPTELKTEGESHMSPLNEHNTLKTRAGHIVGTACSVNNLLNKLLVHRVMLFKLSCAIAALMAFTHNL